MVGKVPPTSYTDIIPAQMTSQLGRQTSKNSEDVQKGGKLGKRRKMLEDFGKCNFECCLFLFSILHTSALLLVLLQEYYYSLFIFHMDPGKIFISVNHVN